MWKYLYKPAGLITLIIILLTGTVIISESGVKREQDMVDVPAGYFIMGHSGDYNDEGPQRRVYLDAYKIDITEITNSDYDKCARDVKCPPKSKYTGFTRRAQPVVGVNWHMAEAYCHYMGKELPTEAQWEKAARGTDGRTYPWGEKMHKRYGKFNPNAGKLRWDKGLRGAVDFARGKPTFVGAYKAGASPYGALDMAGNVWEWTRDWYDEKYHTNSANKNPVGPDEGKWKVLKGGAYYSPPSSVTTYGRYFDKPSARTTFIGFRCVKELE